MYIFDWASLASLTQTVKNPPAMQETQVQAQGREDPQEKGISTHSSILAWRIPWIQWVSYIINWNIIINCRHANFSKFPLFISTRIQDPKLHLFVISP